MVLRPLGIFTGPNYLSPLRTSGRAASASLETSASASASAPAAASRAISCLSSSTCGDKSREPERNIRTRSKEWGPITRERNEYRPATMALSTRSSGSIAELFCGKRSY
eukprot:4062440-Pyramimonas_sp.AAC.2